MPAASPTETLVFLVSPMRRDNMMFSEGQNSALLWCKHVSQIPRDPYCTYESILSGAHAKIKTSHYVKEATNCTATNTVHSDRDATS